MTYHPSLITAAIYALKAEDGSINYAAMMVNNTYQIGFVESVNLCRHVAETIVATIERE